MSVVKGGLALAACFLVSGCMSTYTGSGFKEPGGNFSGAYIPIPLQDQYSGTLHRVAVGGIAFTSGVDEDIGAVAYSGIMPGSDAGLPLSGDMTYTADWGLTRLGAVSKTGNTIYGVQEADGGSIVLSADISSGKVTGRDGPFVVDGRFAGNDLTGKVSYQGDDGTLQGLVGRDGIVGAFHGHDDDSTYAGGFVGE